MPDIYSNSFQGWSLEDSCEGKFSVGQVVRSRGDMGGYKLKIMKIHNSHYAECRDVLPFGLLGRKRHFNMNCLEEIKS